MSRPNVNADARPTEAPPGLGPNPYLQAELKSPIGPESSPYDGRLKGLDGDLLDAMIRGRAQEALHIGHADGFKEASVQYARVYEEGYSTGHRDGAIKQHGELANKCAGHIVKVQAILSLLASTSRSDKRRARIEEGIAAIADVIAHFNAPPVGQ